MEGALETMSMNLDVADGLGKSRLDTFPPPHFCLRRASRHFRLTDARPGLRNSIISRDGLRREPITHLLNVNMQLSFARLPAAGVELPMIKQAS